MVQPHKVVEQLGNDEDGNESDESKPGAAVSHGNAMSYADKAKNDDKANDDKARGRTSLHEIQQDGWTRVTRGSRGAG